LKRVEAYILHNFLSFFLSFFFTLFAISSLVLIIRLADLTGVVNVDFGEFVSLYLFGAPQLLFYTLPIAFFLAAGLSFAKLSFDRELVAMFALGANLRVLMTPIVKIALMLTIALLFIGYFVHPYSVSVAKNFIENKKNISKLNIKPSEAGQKFGDWLVFVSGEKNGDFVDTVLFSASSKASLIGENAGEKNQSSTFVSAKSAQISVQNGGAALVLKDGKGYRLEQNSTKLLHFEEMRIKSAPKESAFQPSNFVAYWKEAFTDSKRAKDFSDVFLTAVFPLASLFFIPAFGIINPRYQKNRAALYLILAVTLFYALMLAINPVLTYLGIFVITPLWFATGYALYKKSGAVRF